MRIKRADLEDEFLFQILAAFRRTLMKVKAADSHVFFGVVREIKMTSDWLRCILVILSTSRMCSRNRSPSRLSVSPMHNLLHNVQVMQ